jgi:hypothetical protein
VCERPEGLLHAIEECLWLGLDQKPARTPIDLGAGPSPTERQRNGAFRLRPVGSDEEGPCVPPAIQPAEGAAVQNAFGLFQLVRF